MSTEYETNPPPPPGNQPPSRAVTLARLAVGALSLGLEQLDNQAARSKTTANEENTSSQAIMILPAAEDRQPPEAVVLSGSVEVRAAQVSRPPPTVAPRHPSAAKSDLQNTLVGLLMVSAQGVDSLAHRLDQATRLAGRVADPLVAPVVGSRAFRPVRRSWEGLVARGQEKVDDWRRIGEAETARGQELLEDVTVSTVNASIDYITVQPKVTDLVTHQTSTLTYEVLTILRGFLFNLDFILEGLLRRLFRMTPRREIPAPARPIRERGVTGFVQMHEKPDLDAPGSWAGYYAGIASRTTSLAIDLTLLAFVLTFLRFFAQQVIEFMRVGLSLLDTPLDQLTLNPNSLANVLVSSFFAYSTFVLYHTLAWCITGATIGDAVAGLRVVTAQGELPGPLRAFLRVTVGYTLSFLLLGFGFLMVLWTPRRRGLHDNLFKTFRVYSWDARPTDRLLRRLAKMNVPEETAASETVNSSHDHSM